jgi:hypothetical protein
MDITRIIAALSVHNLGPDFFNLIFTSTLVPALRLTCQSESPRINPLRLPSLFAVFRIGGYQEPE